MLSLSFVRDLPGKGGGGRCESDVVGLRRAAGDAGPPPEHVRLLSRRPGEGDGVQARRHAQPRRQVPTAPHGKPVIFTPCWMKVEGSLGSHINV